MYNHGRRSHVQRGVETRFRVRALNLGLARGGVDVARSRTRTHLMTLNVSNCVHIRVVYDLVHAPSMRPQTSMLDQHLKCICGFCTRINTLSTHEHTAHIYTFFGMLVFVLVMMM